MAFLSFSNFGGRLIERTERIRDAIRILDRLEVDFEYDGEMQADVAMDHELMKSVYPFCRLSGPANILIMPGLNAANIGSKLVQQLGGGTVIGPILLGLAKPAQIVPMGSTVNDLVNAGVLVAYEALSD